MADYDDIPEIPDIEDDIPEIPDVDDEPEDDNGNRIPPQTEIEPNPMFRKRDRLMELDVLVDRIDPEHAREYQWVYLTDIEADYARIPAAAIVDYDINMSLGAWPCVGGVCANSFTLNLSRKYFNPAGMSEWMLDPPSSWRSRKFIVRLRIANEDGEFTNNWIPFGVWTVNEVEYNEQNGIMRISGYDSIANSENVNVLSELAYASDWGLSNKTVGDAFAAQAAMSYITENGVFPIARDSFPGSSASLRNTKWRVDTTGDGDYKTYLNREMLGVLAEAVGGFVYVGLDGRPDIRAFGERPPVRISADSYIDYTPGCDFFTGRALQVYRSFDDETDPTTYFANDGDYDFRYDPTNTVLLDCNPIWHGSDGPAIARDVATRLGEMDVIYDGKLNWVGDPTTVFLGSTIVVESVVDTEDANKHRHLVLGLTYHFGTGGLSSTITCELPHGNDVLSPGYSGSISGGGSSGGGGGSISGSILDYTTAENLTGAKWIDGKPVYRIVSYDDTTYSFPKGSDTIRQVPTHATDVETVISLSVMRVTSDGAFYPVPLYNATASANWTLATGNLLNDVSQCGMRYYGYAAQSGVRFLIVMEYTKTH